MIPGSHNFTIKQGSTFRRRLRIKNPDGTPFNLTGYTGRMQIRRQVSDSTFYVELTTQNGRMTFTPLLGQIDLYLSDDVTKLIPRDGVYDLEIEDTYGEVFAVMEGLVRLKLEVTR